METSDPRLISTLLRRSSRVHALAFENPSTDVLDLCCLSL